MLDDVTGLQTQLMNLVREGTVSQVLAEKHACRVVFEDRDNLVSAVLPVLTLFAYKNQSYALPAVGERVVVLSSPNDSQAHSGYIIGSLYTGQVTPPESDAQITKLKFADGSYAEFDGENLELNVKGRIRISSERGIFINANDDITMQGENIRLN